MKKSPAVPRLFCFRLPCHAEKDAAHIQMLLEDNGDRGVFTPIIPSFANWVLKPQHVYRMADMLEIRPFHCYSCGAERETVTSGAAEMEIPAQEAICCEVIAP